MTQKPQKQKLLLLEDDAVYAQLLARTLSAKGFDVKTYPKLEGFLELAIAYQADFVILDLFLDGETSLELIAPLKQALPQSRLLMLTGYASIATTVEAIKAGADDYIPKPASSEQILTALSGNQAQQALAEPISVERLEWEHIQRLLQEQKGNISATARILGMHRRTLQRKLANKPHNK